MIKTKMGMVKISGTTPMILSDLACISGAIAEKGLSGINSKEALKEAVLHAVELGFEEDLESCNKEKLDTELEKAVDLFCASLVKIFGKGNGEE